MENKKIKQIGKYLLVKELGKGAQGRVYFAVKEEDRSLEFAIKQIPNKHLEVSDWLVSFNNEIEALQSLYHPNIIRLVEIYSTDNNKYLVMEYCEGGDLETVINNGKLVGEELGLLVLKDLIGAFRYAEKKKVTHRDIKPMNIFLKNGRAMLGDFGLCKLNNDVCETKLGSPFYIAPEVFNLENKYDYRCDIYSFGATLYHLMTGHTVINPTSIQAVWNHLEKLQQSISKNQLPLPAGISLSKETTELLISMLQKDPAKRPTWDQVSSHPATTKPLTNELKLRRALGQKEDHLLPQPQRPSEVSFKGFRVIGSSNFKSLFL